jgi:hypothetical protein
MRQRENALLLGGLAAIALFLVAVAVLVSGWEYGADDVRFVREYSVLQPSGEVQVDWSRVGADWAGPWAGNRNLDFYRPVVSTSLAVDFALFGFSPGASAVINTALHLLTALLLALLALRILPDRKSALLAAAFFALTPLAHENLAWGVGRCGLTTGFGLAAALLFVGGYAKGRRGISLHAAPVLLTLLNLATMESAVAWTMFPVVALLLRAWFFPKEGAPSLRQLAWLAAPYAAVVPLYLLWRALVLDSVFGASPIPMQPQSLLGWVSAPFELLYESIVPRDVGWFEKPMQLRIWQWICVLPVLLGLLAPFWFSDPRSVRYRKALGLLLAFWFMSRIPNMELRIGEGLEASRAAFYSYPALALLLGLLLATSRYAFWLGLLGAGVFGAMLWGRLDIRVHEAERGRRALELLEQRAQDRDRPLLFVNQVNGKPGAPSYHAGEMPMALAPPFVERRIDAISLHLLIARQPPELPAAASFATAARGISWIKPLGPSVTIEEPNYANFAKPLPRERVDFELIESPEALLGLAPRAELSGLEGEQGLLILVGGPTPLLLPLSRQARFDAWPDRAAATLKEWRKLLGPGAPYAALIELRTDLNAPDSATARSAVVFGRLR